MPSITSGTPQMYPPEDLHQLQKDTEVRPIQNLTNPDKDHFNESLLTLLNGQQGLQIQSFNMIQDITHRQEYDTLMRDIPIYGVKNMDLAD